MFVPRSVFCFYGSLYFCLYVYWGISGIGPRSLPYCELATLQHCWCLAQEAENLPGSTYSVRGVGDLPCPPNLALGSGRTAAAGLGTCCRSVGSWKIGTWSLCVSVDTWSMRSTDQGLALNQTGGCSGKSCIAADTGDTDTSALSHSASVISEQYSALQVHRALQCFLRTLTFSHCHTVLA